MSFVLDGVGLEMRAVGLQDRAVHQAVAGRLLDDPVQYLLRYRRVTIAPTPVLQQRRGIEDPSAAAAKTSDRRR